MRTAVLSAESEAAIRRQSRVRAGATSPSAAARWVPASKEKTGSGPPGVNR